MTAQSESPDEKSPPWFRTDGDRKGLNLRFGGTWKSIGLEGIENQLQVALRQDVPKDSSIKIILENDCILDMAGACLISGVIKNLRNQKRALKVDVLSSHPLLERFLGYKDSCQKPTRAQERWKIGWLDSLGYKTSAYGQKVLNLLAFLGEVIITWLKTFRASSGLRWVSVFRQAEEIGVKALPIIGLISFLIGMVLAYQSINQLSRFGAQLYTVDFLGIGLLREIAVLITAIVIAGRSGSAFTAQIGSMALNQEIDAIRMLGLNPILVLVVPRLVAILVCLPLLVFFAMVTGLLGGMVMLSLTIDLSPMQFMNQLQRSLSPGTFWVGMSKAPLFAIVIGMVGCYRGLRVKGSAESVGRQTTQSVVESIFLVIVLDAFMSILFSYLKV